MEEQNKQHAWEAEMQDGQGNMEEVELQNMDQTEEMKRATRVEKKRLEEQR